jgi:hypothetical protein
MGYLYGLAMGLPLLGAFVGWGTLLARLALGREAIGGGIRAGLGVALTLGLGGVANLASAFARPLAWAYVAAGLGILAWFVRPWERPVDRLAAAWSGARKDPLQLALGVAVVGLALVRYAGSVYMEPRFYVWSPVDDFKGYLVFAEKLVQSGGIGPDPFNGRQLTAGLGGTALLQAVVLTLLPLPRLNIIEPGIPILVVVWLLVGGGRAAGAPRAGLLLALFYLLFPEPRINTSSIQMPVALFLALVGLLGARALERTSAVRAGWLVGLLASANLTLKGTNAPAVGIILVVAYGALLIDRGTRRRAAHEGAVALAASVALTAPWMIAQYRSGGTPFFPFLGSGFHGPAQSSWAMLSAVPGHAMEVARRTLFRPGVRELALLLIVYVAAGPRLIGSRAGVLAMALAALVSAVGVDVGAGGAMPRLLYSFVCAGLLATAGALCVPLAGAAARGRWRAGVAITGLGLALAPGLTSTWGTVAWYRITLADIKAGLEGADGGLVVGRSSARRLQEPVPPGARLLAWIERPYLLDFRRNPVWVLDQPGAASPSPGLPLREGSEALARYLGAQGVRYVAFEYGAGGTVALYSPAIRPRFNLDRPAPWYRPYHEFAFALYVDMQALGRTRQRVHDDGRIFVVDLDRRL